MPLLLNRIEAAAHCGLSPKVFDELVRPLTRPVKARSASRWTISDLERAVDLLQDRAREEPACPSTGERIPAAGSFTLPSKGGQSTATPPRVISLGQLLCPLRDILAFAGFHALQCGTGSGQ